jgi:dTDP-4-dehydrorhamnose reductase
LRIVIVGRGGQIAWELQRRMAGIGEIAAIGRPDIDLCDPDPMRHIIRRLEPQVLVNAAAFTAVDRAEAEPERAMALNAVAPGVMAEEAQRLGALFVHYSTDYVFDGRKTSPYTELDQANPLNVYGASKLAGDHAVEAVGGAFLIFRTSWVFAPRGNNFLLTIMKLAAQREELRVVDDQTGAPTSSHDIAAATAQIIRQMSAGHDAIGGLGDRAGIYNMTSQGSTSWCGFAATIVEEMRSRGMHHGRLARIIPIAASEYPAAAMRPKNSCLCNEKLRATFGVALPEWKTSLAHVMQELAMTGSAPTN